MTGKFSLARRYFELILNWLRDRGAPVELPLENLAFRHELEYYGLREALKFARVLVIGGRQRPEPAYAPKNKQEHNQENRAAEPNIRCFSPPLKYRSFL